MDFQPVEYNVPYSKDFINKIRDIKGVKSIRAEIKLGAIANSITDNANVTVQAIDYTNKQNYKRLSESIIKGKFLYGDNQFLIGYKLANFLNVKLGEKIIILTTDKYGSMNAVEGKIVGIYNTHSPQRDEFYVITSLKTAQSLLNLDDSVIEYKVNLKDYKKADIIAKAIEEKLPKEYVAIPWQISFSILKEMMKVMDISIFIIAGIIIFVASLGITNSFLMNIISRYNEYGILRTMGVMGNQLMKMILSESFILGLIGSIAGLIPGSILVYYFYIHPINYEKMAEGFEAMPNMDTMVGTVFKTEDIIIVFLTGIIISIVASIYPATIAIKEKPADIMRSTK